jgi:hypothetical protein
MNNLSHLNTLCYGVQAVIVSADGAHGLIYAVVAVFDPDLQAGAPSPVVHEGHPMVPPRVVFPVWAVFHKGRRVLLPAVFWVRSAVFLPAGRRVADGASG